MKKRTVKLTMALALALTLGFNWGFVGASVSPEISIGGEETKLLIKQETKENFEEMDDTKMNISFEEYKKTFTNRRDARPFSQVVRKLADGLEIIETDFNWNGGEAALNLYNRPKTISLHHAAAERPGETIPVTEIHQWHLANGWTGIGYHFWITKDGKIYRGRPENATGAHTYTNNQDSIGISCEGNYEVNPEFSEAQKNSLEALIKYLKDKYPITKIGGHNEFPNNSTTLCPGKYYPLQDMKNYFYALTPSIDYSMKSEFAVKVNEKWQGYDYSVDRMVGKPSPIQDLRIKLVNPIEATGSIYNTQVEYQVCKSNGEWTAWTEDGRMATNLVDGSSITALRVRLKGIDADKYSIEYRVSYQGNSWEKWAADGQISGYENYGKTIKNIDIRVVKK